MPNVLNLHFSSRKAPSTIKKPKIALKSQNNSTHSARATSSTNDSAILVKPEAILVKSEPETTENDHIEIDDAIPPEEEQFQEFDDEMDAEYEDSSFQENAETTEEPTFTTAGVKGTLLSDILTCHLESISRFRVNCP